MTTWTRTTFSLPYHRPRRLRSSESLRGLVRETEVNAADFIYPLFIAPGQALRHEVPSMPGVFNLSIDQLAAEAEDVLAHGIPAVLLFGLPESKDEVGSGAYAGNGIVQRAIRELKRVAPELIVITDVCLCEYTSHGHCGIVANGTVDNDQTLDLIAQTALSHAEAGADVVAPSDMMDGRIRAVRQTLDGSGFQNTPIIAYSAKYASGFYGPFREAADSAPQFGDRRAYQMDPPNRREALREMALDVDEGADVIMVKPALAYLDVIRDARERFDLPLCAYNVSGEYSMVKAAAQNGWIDERRIVTEVLTGIKRAGADVIITYHAKDFVRWQRELR